MAGKEKKCHVKGSGGGGVGEGRECEKEAEQSTGIVYVQQGGGDSRARKLKMVQRAPPSLSRHASPIDRSHPSLDSMVIGS